MCERDLRELLDAVSTVRPLRTRYNYSDKLHQLEPLFAILQQKDLPM